ncbi:MAG: RNA polymerase sigma factor [Myxococcota bacterium]
MATTTTLTAAPAEPASEDIDVQLAKRCLEGDEAALRQLYDQNVAAVHRMVRLNAGLGTSTDDLVQDTFVRALELLPRYRGDARLAIWMRGIALNLCRTQRRTAWRRRLLRRRVLPPADASTSAEPECRVELQQLLTQLEALPATEREAFVMCRVEQLSLADAAAVIGASKSTIGDRVQRADAKLRTQLAEGTNA